MSYYIFECTGEKVILQPYPITEPDHDCARIYSVVIHDFHNIMRPKGFIFWPPVKYVRKLSDVEYVTYRLLM